MWTYLRIVLYVAFFALHQALFALAAFLCWKDVMRLHERPRYPFWENVRDSYEGEPGLMFCGLSEIFGEQWSYSKIRAVLTDDLISKFIDCCDQSWECSSRTPTGGAPRGMQASLTLTHRLQTGFWVLSALYLVCLIVYLVYKLYTWCKRPSADVPVQPQPTAEQEAREAAETKAKDATVIAEAAQKQATEAAENLAKAQAAETLAADKRTTEAAEKQAAEALTAQLDIQMATAAFAQAIDAIAVRAPGIALAAPAPPLVMTRAEAREQRMLDSLAKKFAHVAAVKRGEVP